MTDLVLAVDAGTTGVRVNAVDRRAAIVASRYREFAQHYPEPGWVEHDAEEIFETTRRLLADVLADVRDPRRVAAIGITNQRETAVLWERKTGRPLHRAIVWQDRRTASICQSLRRGGLEPKIRRRTGLVLDAYFSASKVTWLVENVPEIALRLRSSPDDVCFGTIDTWLAFRLSGGRAHVTDPTNASRTLLYDIDRRAFDADLSSSFGVPVEILPAVIGSAECYGETVPQLTGGVAIPLAGLAGDQQSALFGQGCFLPGESKNTYGTGCFALVNCGAERPPEPRGLVTTLACDGAGRPVYALEGSVFVAGAVVQWLRDGLGLLGTAAETESIAASVPDTGGVTFVPAFAGLGAPYWDMDARGAILGLTRGTTRAHIVRAALEAIAYETRDLVEALEAAAGKRISELRVDGGASANGFLLQFQADLLGRPLVRPANTETTALGAAFLAGLATGFWRSSDELGALIGGGLTRFEPRMPGARREELYAGWKTAVRRVLA